MVVLAVSTPSRGTNGEVPVLSTEASGAPSCKRPRLHSLLHASFPQCAPAYVDRLQSLYPHPRDRDCHLDDKLHQYHVLGQPYNLSVSGWWKKYFEDFHLTHTSRSIVQRCLGNSGFRATPECLEQCGSQHSGCKFQHTASCFCSETSILENRFGR